METFWQFLSDERVWNLVRATLLIFVGFVVARIVSALARKVLSTRLTAPQTRLIRRIVFYLILALFITSALRELGFSLATLLGAAGIFSVALGFASQTSASNFVSGLFLMVEKPFVVGDTIKIGNTTGEVLSIDMLSVKLRTFDNLFVRIPNESILKSESSTLTRFPIRRADLLVGVAYREDIDRVREVLMEVADQNPLCLEEPKPLFIFQGFGDSALNIQFSVWAKRENFLEMKNSIQIEIKQAFDAENIEIPFPHRSLYAGSLTEPFPVRVVDGEATG